MFATEHQTEEIPKPLADIVREETDDGRLVVRFLIDIMQGKVDDSKPCHRLDAARQLLNLGFHGAQAVIQSVSQPTNGRAPSRATSVSRFDQGIADIIKLETSDGRDAVRFLVDVMQGNLDDFKPCTTASQPPKNCSGVVSTTPPVTPTTSTKTTTNRSTMTPAAPTTWTPTLTGTTTKTTRSTSKTTMKSNSCATGTVKGPCVTSTAAKKPSQSPMKPSPGTGNRPLFDESHIPDRDFTPIEKPRSMTSSGKGHYGYNALRFAFERQPVRQGRQQDRSTNSRS